MTDMVRMADLLEAQVDELSPAARKSFDEFRRLGFDGMAALRLVRAHAPWLRVERALLADCSLELALEIWT
jgi:hypothetical protein